MKTHLASTSDSQLFLNPPTAITSRKRTSLPFTTVHPENGTVTNLPFHFFYDDGATVSTGLEELISLMQSGESEVLEFKESAGKKIHHEIAAFAHSDGGTILVGVSDRGKIVDTGGKAALDKVPGSVQSILPPLPIKTETISGGTPNSPEDLRRHIHS